MSAARAVGAGASALVHAVLLLAFLLPAKPIAEPPKATPIRSEDEGIDWRLLPSQPAGNGLACTNQYRGIGIVTSFSGYVREVVGGGPADIAGMRVGDRFLNDGMYLRDAWPIGKDLELVVERDGQQLRLQVRIGRICYAKS